MKACTKDMYAVYNRCTTGYISYTCIMYKDICMYMSVPRTSLPLLCIEDIVIHAYNKKKDNYNFHNSIQDVIQSFIDIISGIQSEEFLTIRCICKTTKAKS